MKHLGRQRRVRATARARRFGVLALSLMVLVVGGAVVCAPAGAQTSAAQIDTLLAQYGSPLAGMGQTFVDAGAANGVDPAFLVAIAGAESTFGENIYSVAGDYAVNNAWNWFYAAPWPASDFSSWEDGLNQVAAGIAGPLYYGVGLYSVAAIAPVYCPDGTQNWIDNVTTFMVALGADPNDTRLNVVTVVAPAQLSPVLPVSVAPAVRHVARPISITFDVTNSGAETGAWGGVMLQLFARGCDPVYRAANESFALAPGETKRFSTTVRLPVPGRWYGLVQAINADGAQTIGDTPTFTIVVRAAGQRAAQWLGAQRIHSGRE